MATTQPPNATERPTTSSATQRQPPGPDRLIALLLPLQFELATRIPLIIKVPWKTSSIGRRTVALVEAVDFYKTLVGLAGLPPPASIGEQLNGTSLEPLFDDPTNRSFSPAAFSQFAKDDTFSVENKFHRNQTKLMGCVPRDLPPPPSPERRCRRVQRSVHCAYTYAPMWQ